MTNIDESRLFYPSSARGRVKMYCHDGFGLGHLRRVPTLFEVADQRPERREEHDHRAEGRPQHEGGAADRHHLADVGRRRVHDRERIDGRIERSPGCWIAGIKRAGLQNPRNVGPRRTSVIRE